MLRLAAPNVMSRLSIMAMGLTDAIVVGHYSAVELGYHALGWAATGTVLVAGIGLLQGVHVMTARFIGAGQPERTGAVLRRGLAYAFLIAVGAIALLLLAGPPLMRMLVPDDDLFRGAVPVMVIFTLSLLPYLLADAMWFWLEAQGKPAVPMAAMWLANAVNLALCLWLVPGNSPFPVSGAEAAAWTTLFARTALLIALAGFILWWPRSRAVNVFRRAPHEPEVAREQRRIGHASGISHAIEAGAFSGLNFIAAQISVMAVATWTVILNVSAMVFMVPLGISAAAAIMVSRAVGARDIRAVRKSYRMGIQLALAVVFLISVMLFLMPEMVARAYSSEAWLVKAVASGLGIACLAFLADGAQVVAAQCLRSRGDIWWPTGMHLFSYLVIMIPFCWWLGVHLQLGVNGIVWGMIAASLVSAMGLNLRWNWLGDRMAEGHE